MATGTCSVGSLAVTLAASQVIAPVPRLPSTIPAAATKAYEVILETCRSVGVAELKRMVQALRAAQAWVRRSSRYVFLVGRNQEVKEALPTILDENVKVLSTFITADMDDRFGINLNDAERSFTGSSTLGLSLASKRGHVGPPARSSS